MIVIRASLVVKEGMDSAARAAFLEVMRGSNKEKGCVAYQFTADISDPRTVHVLEFWESEADLLAHLQGDAFNIFMAASANLVDPIGMSALAGDLAPYAFPM